MSYGSQWHLLRYLGYHRQKLNRLVGNAIGGEVVEWLDMRFNNSSDSIDREWRGLDFLNELHPVQKEWREFWPHSGNLHNWDAVGRTRIDGIEQWVLVEAKAHLDEMRSSCAAIEQDGGQRDQIRAAFAETKTSMKISPAQDWLQPYYQYANRLSTLYFLTKHNIPARLLFVYFCGDKNPHGNCPTDKAGWQERLTEASTHLGLNGRSPYERKIHKLFLPVCPAV